MTANDVISQQAYCQHKFHYYRNGLPNFQATYNEIADGDTAGDPHYVPRWADIQRRALALPGLPGVVNPPAASFNFTVAHRNRLRNVAFPNRHPFRNTVAPLGTAPLGSEAQEAIQVEYTKGYKLMRSSFRYIKCLGWGGDGIVSLWRYSPGAGQEHSVVMKMSTQWEFAEPNSRKPRVTNDFLDEERDMITVSGILRGSVSQRVLTKTMPIATRPSTALSTTVLHGTSSQGNQSRFKAVSSCSRFRGRHGTED